MYRIKDEYGNILEETVNPQWLKQQKRVDCPVSANNYQEADGVVLSDGETMVGIAGRGMDNYTPLVDVEEVSSDPYLFQQLNETSNKLDTKASQDKVESLEQQTTALMMGMVDVYSKLEAISASIESNNSSITVETNE